jgi:hypothetical protein
MVGGTKKVKVMPILKFIEELIGLSRQDLGHRASGLGSNYQTCMHWNSGPKQESRYIHWGIIAIILTLIIMSWMFTD